MSKRTRTSKIEKWIKEGRGSEIGVDYKIFRTLHHTLTARTVFVKK